MPEITRRKTSMADIARAAGVSEATVDRVLNGRGSVSREKETRVLEWARKLKIDRALGAVSVRWLRIAILLQRPLAPYYLHLKQGFELAQKTFEAQRAICAVTYFESLDAASVVETIRRATQKADALIIVAYEHPISRRRCGRSAARCRCSRWQAICPAPGAWLMSASTIAAPGAWRAN
jgi:LacI family transcriptional regulator